MEDSKKRNFPFFQHHCIPYFCTSSTISIPEKKIYTRSLFHLISEPRRNFLNNNSQKLVGSHANTLSLEKKKWTNLPATLCLPVVKLRRLARERKHTNYTLRWQTHTQPHELKSENLVHRQVNHSPCWHRSPPRPRGHWHLWIPAGVLLRRRRRRGAAAAAAVASSR